tara:strand:+ start:525 stop:833 length:309 start_codon:yes stop_codon:yes gene_type:complete
VPDGRLAGSVDPRGQDSGLDPRNGIQDSGAGNGDIVQYALEYQCWKIGGGHLTFSQWKAQSFLRFYYEEYLTEKWKDLVPEDLKHLIETHTAEGSRDPEISD